MVGGQGWDPLSGRVMEGELGHLVPADWCEGQGEEVPSGAGLRGGLRSF